MIISPRLEARWTGVGEAIGLRQRRTKKLDEQDEFNIFEDLLLDIWGRSTNHAISRWEVDLGVGEGRAISL